MVNLNYCHLEYNYSVHERLTQLHMLDALQQEPKSCKIVLILLSISSKRNKFHKGYFSPSPKYWESNSFGTLGRGQHCDGVSTKASLSFTSLAGYGRENAVKVSWVEISMERDHSPISIIGKAGSSGAN